jgi:ABC-type transport system substrate-binding protein
VNHDQRSRPLSRRILLQGSAATAAAMGFVRMPNGSDATPAVPDSPHPLVAAAELPENAAPQDQQVLRVMGREGRYLDWSKSVQDRQFESALITEPLVRRNENYELMPAGAESWDVSDDSLTWTFHLRPGMTWSDGTPVTAEDYAYTVRRMADPETAFDVTFYYGSIKNFTEANAGDVPLD